MLSDSYEIVVFVSIWVYGVIEVYLLWFLLSYVYFMYYYYIYVLFGYYLKYVYYNLFLKWKVFVFIERYGNKVMGVNLIWVKKNNFRYLRLIKVLYFFVN